MKKSLFLHNNQLFRRGLVISLLALFSLCPLINVPTAEAATLKSTYPRLANYFLKWEISETEAKELAKWDLLILDMETQENSPDQLRTIRRLNPDVIMLAYITSQEIISNIDDYDKAYLRQELSDKIDGSWWLKDASGNKTSNWSGTHMLNLSDGAGKNQSGQRFNDYLPEFITSRLQASGLWDGVFYDNTWGDVAWINGGNLDLDNDGRAESVATANNLWVAGVKKLLTKTRSLAGSGFIIVGNGRVYDGYQPLINGMMLENFPSSWENGGTWSGSMATYWRLPNLNSYPSLPIINAYDKDRKDYQHLRFGLTSTLLGEGFYSFDYDVTNHGQIWWYDEYDVNLGTAESAAYNLLAAGDPSLKAGLWRRDFQQGAVIVNSTNKKQTYLLDNEELEKIKGTQDPATNSGLRVNYVQLNPSDGAVFRKTAARTIQGAPFINGYFYRSFDPSGTQAHSGFFSYLKAYAGDSEVVAFPETNTYLNATAGQISLYRNGQKTLSLYPYSKIFKKSLSLAVLADNNEIKKIISGAGLGGGPQVVIFSGAGKQEGTFFAYDKNFRGGVNVAIADVDGDGTVEIITGPGPGLEPRVKVFALNGTLKSNFLAYDAKFRGGVNVAAGNVTGNGTAEIITGPMSAGGPQVRIFNSSGKCLSSFFAYDKALRGGLKITLSDTNDDGRLEILAGLKNFR